MDTIKCIECDRGVSPRLVSCPHCGGYVCSVEWPLAKLPPTELRVPLYESDDAGRGQSHVPIAMAQADFEVIDTRLEADPGHSATIKIENGKAIECAPQSEPVSLAVRLRNDNGEEGEIRFEPGSISVEAGDVVRLVDLFMRGEYTHTVMVRNLNRETEFVFADKIWAFQKDLDTWLNDLNQVTASPFWFAFIPPALLFFAITQLVLPGLQSACAVALGIACLVSMAGYFCQYFFRLKRLNRWRRELMAITRRFVDAHIQLGRHRLAAYTSGDSLPFAGETDQQSSRTIH